MVYVLDTNIFRKLLDHFPKKGKAFESVWEALDEAIVNKTVVSVDECFNEIANHYSPDSDNFKWIKSRKEMFLNPTNAESLILKELFQKSKMQEQSLSENMQVSLWEITLPDQTTYFRQMELQNSSHHYP